MRLTLSHFNDCIFDIDLKNYESPLSETSALNIMINTSGNKLLMKLGLTYCNIDQLLRKLLILSLSCLTHLESSLQPFEEDGAISQLY